MTTIVVVTMIILLRSLVVKGGGCCREVVFDDHHLVNLISMHAKEMERGSEIEERNSESSPYFDAISTANCTKVYILYGS